MLTPQTPVPDQGDGLGPSSYGLGWTIRRLGPQTLVSHGGNNGEYKAFGGFIRETRDGFVVLTNGSNGIEVIKAILGPPSE